MVIFKILLLNTHFIFQTKTLRIHYSQFEIKNVQFWDSLILVLFVTRSEFQTIWASPWIKLIYSFQQVSLFILINGMQLQLHNFKIFKLTT